MKLTDLEPTFLRIEDDRTYRYEGVGLVDADGVTFLCPKCFAAKSGPYGVHSIICWRPRVPQTFYPTPGRWEFQGTGFADLSLVAASSSVSLTTGCRAHFFVERGEIRMC